MSRPRSEDERKEQIRAAATRCFVKRGYAATRLSDIAREAGLSKGGIYFHYKAKEDLFFDILEDLSASLQKRWAFDDIREQAPERMLGQLVTAHLRTIQDEPEEVRLLNLLVVMAVQDAPFRDKLEEVTHIMRDLYAGVLAQGIADGVFVAGEPEVLALSILAYVNGLAAFTVLDAAGRLPVPPEVAAEQVLRMVKVQRSVSSVEFGGRAKKDQPN